MIYSTNVLDTPEFFLYICAGSSFIGFLILIFTVSRKGFDAIEQSNGDDNKPNTSLEDQLLNNNYEHNSTNMMNNFIGEDQQIGRSGQESFYSPDGSSRNNSTSSPIYIY